MHACFRRNQDIHNCRPFDTIIKIFKTKQSFIAFLNNLIEEGIAKITTYAMIWDREVKANVITAVTDKAIEDGRHEWAELGFLSRFMQG